LKTELKKANSEEKNDKIVITNLVLQRLRDYYHPLATKKLATDEQFKDFNKFTLSLLKLYLEDTSSKKNKAYL
jgi:hypothetical protein